MILRLSYFFFPWLILSARYWWLLSPPFSAIKLIPYGENCRLLQSFFFSDSRVIPEIKLKCIGALSGYATALSTYTSVILRLLGISSAASLTRIFVNASVISSSTLQFLLCCYQIFAFHLHSPDNFFIKPYCD